MNVRRLAPLLIFAASCAPRARGLTSGPYAAAAAPQVMAPSLPGITISAAAPSGIDSSFLGVPLDVHFNPFQGADGATLYPGAPIASTPLNEMEHGVVFSEDTVGFDANARAWSFLSASAGAQATSRFASYRARQLERVDSLGDRVAARAAPPGAVFYPWKIYYGHSYEAVMYGSANSFHAGIKAKLSKQLSGGIKLFAERENLDYKFRGLGMSPKSGEAIFAFSAEQIAQSYDSSGPPVPIFIEYRSIPGAVVERRALPWLASYRVTVKFASLKVFKQGAMLFDPHWRIWVSCDQNNKQVPGSSAPLWNAAVDDNNPAYPLSWTQTFEAAGPSDQLGCTVNGTFMNKVGTYALPTARTQPIAISPGVAQVGEFEGASADVRYRIAYTVSVTENPSP